MSAWNAFQKSHAGQGLSRSEMSAAYQASRSSSTSSSSASYGGCGGSYGGSSSGARSGGGGYGGGGRHGGGTGYGGGYTTPASTPTAAGRSAPPNSSTRSTSSPNPYNEFQKANAGKGWSPSEMSRQYHGSRSGSSSLMSKSPATIHSTAARGTTAAASAASASTGSSVRRPNPWNEFQQQNAGKSWTPARMKEEYALSKSGISAAPKSTTVTSRTPNRWTKFLQEEKGQGLSMQELSDKYRKLPKSQKKRKAVDMGRGGLDLQELVDLLRDLNPNFRQLEDVTEEDKDRLLETEDYWQAQMESRNRVRFADVRDNASLLKDSLRSSSICGTSATNYELSEDDIVLEKEKIGHGAFGEVFAGVLTLSDKNKVPVAVKKPHLSISKKNMKGFVQEFKTIALDHPSIIQLFGYVVFKAPDRIGIVMEFMPGGSLWDVLHGAPIPSADRESEGSDSDSSVECELTISDKGRMVEQMLAGVDYLHESSIAHRDIKTRNLLLNKDLSVLKISDFGLAKYRNEAVTSTSASRPVKLGGGVGTPRYMAPEVLAQQQDEDNFEELCKADIYSCAIVVAELLAEVEPFYGVSYAKLKKLVVEQNKRPDDLLVEAGVDSCPKALIRVIGEAWLSDPKERPPAYVFLQKIRKTWPTTSSSSSSTTASTTTATTSSTLVETSSD